MAGGLNKVMIIGNLGKDPEMRFTPSGQSVTNFTVAVSRSWKNSDGQPQEETEWFNIDAWGRLAELTNEYLSKGKKVYVEGRLRTESWEDKNTGEKKYRTKVVASDIQFIEPRGGGQSDSGYGGGTASPAPEADQSFEEMPF
jgi:single-strand DNA-binding protein